MGTIPASENEYPEVLFAEGAAPATPAAGLVKAYAKSDGLLYQKDDTGAETVLSPAAHIADTTDAHDASAVSFDPTGLTNVSGTEVQTAIEEIDAALASGGISPTIVDAAGDLIVGTAADTVARLAIGAAGGYLSRINGDLAWNSGTSFPTAAAGDRYWRTDLSMEFYYDGTRWLSTQLFTTRPVGKIPGTTTTSVGDLQASIAATTGSAVRFGLPSVQGASNIWLVSYKVSFMVNSGGTALGASHKWVETIIGVDSAAGSTGTAITTNIDSGASGTWRETTTAIGAAAAAGTVVYTATWTKTGTPGTLITAEELTYRIIAT